jgi:hypothetical protein
MSKTAWTINAALDASVTVYDKTQLYDAGSFYDADPSYLRPNDTNWSVNATLDASTITFDDSNTNYDSTTVFYDSIDVTLIRPNQTSWTSVEP